MHKDTLREKREDNLHQRWYEDWVEDWACYARNRYITQFALIGLLIAFFATAFYNFLPL